MNTKKLTATLATSLVLGLFLVAPLASAFAQADLSAPHGRPTPRPRVPEIDPNIAVSGLAMLSGGVLLIADRFRRSRR